MEIIETGIPGLLVIKPKSFGDSRGYFCETYNKKAYEAVGIKQNFCQDNLSKSSYGVIRGLHYQLQPESQAKLVSVVIGEVYDVAVDTVLSSTVDILFSRVSFSFSPRSMQILFTERDKVFSLNQ